MAASVSFFSKKANHSLRPMSPEFSSQISTQKWSKVSGTLRLASLTTSQKEAACEQKHNFQRIMTVWLLDKNQSHRVFCHIPRYFGITMAIWQKLLVLVKVCLMAPFNPLCNGPISGPPNRPQRTFLKLPQIGDVRGIMTQILLIHFISVIVNNQIFQNQIPDRAAPCH